MLKAVRFDLQEHEELLEFIDNYRDKKNKPNHSEAMRMLMQKGLESLNNHIETPQPAVDVESMKAEIFNQIMNQIQSMGINQPQQPSQPLTQPTVQSHGVKSPPSTPRPAPPKPQPIPKTTTNNPLLANLLGNANR